jgi:hypothetical protein
MTPDTGRVPFCVYVEVALDRIDVAGPQTEEALRAEARAMREAASVLERRATSAMVTTLTTAPDKAAFNAGRPLL